MMGAMLCTVIIVMCEFPIIIDSIVLTTKGVILYSTFEVE